MAICPACGEENPEGFQFCGYCSAPLTGQVASAAVHEERKVVSVLFCDLVGFTAASDRADPEDVRARLRTYYTRLRHELESFEQGDRLGAVVGLDEADDDIRPAFRGPATLVEHVVGLADARSGAEVHAQRAAAHAW